MENTSIQEKETQPDAAWESEANPPETTDETTIDAEIETDGVRLSTLSSMRSPDVSEKLASTEPTEKLIDLVEDDLRVIEEAKSSATGSIDKMESDTIVSVVEDVLGKEIELPSIIEKVSEEVQPDTTPTVGDTTTPTQTEELAPPTEAVEKFEVPQVVEKVSPTDVIEKAKTPEVVEKVDSDAIEPAKTVATPTENMELTKTVEVPKGKAVESEVDADHPKNANKLDETISVVAKDPVSENASPSTSQLGIKPEPIKLLQTQTRPKIAGADHSLKTPKKTPVKSSTHSPMVASPLKSMNGSPAVRSAKRVPSIRASLPATQEPPARSVSHRVSLPLAPYGDGNNPSYMRPTIASLSKKVDRLELEHSNDNNNRTTLV